MFRKRNKSADPKERQEQQERQEQKEQEEQKERKQKRGFFAYLWGAITNSTNYFIVALLVAVIFVWMSSGNSVPPPVIDVNGRTNANVKSVLVQPFAREETERTIQISGYTQEERMVAIKAELSARVVSIAVQENDAVRKNTRLIRLEQGQAAARLQQARAQERQTQIELDSERKLRQQGLSSAAAEARASASYEAAKAAVTLAQRDFQSTIVRAPFAGQVEEIYVEEGDYVQPGQLLAKVVDYQPMLVIGSLSELEVGYVDEDTKATISLVTGETLTGVVRHLATQSNPQTRTFDVEVEVPNEDNNLRAGITAELSFHTGSITATRISPSLLSLDEQGNLGVKTVSDNRVFFTPVEVVKAGTNEMWVTGIGEGTQVIIRGHGFVEIGEEVSTQQESG